MNPAPGPVPENDDEALRQADALRRRGEVGEAMGLCHAVLRRQPGHAGACCLLGSIHAQTGLHLEALKLYDRALRLRPGFPQALNNRGITLLELRRLDDALSSFDQVLSLDPRHPNAHLNRGVVLRHLGRLEEALESYDQAISCRPDFAEAFNHRGLVLRLLQRPAPALASLDRAIAIRPGNATAFHNRGIVLRELGQLEESLASCEQALRLQPQYAEAWWHKAELLLLKGDYQQGWPLYEWRWRTGTLSADPRLKDVPLWLGEEDISGKTILLHAEQGFGDTFQFCRYALLVAAKGARVILAVRGAVLPLFEHWRPLMQVVSIEDPLPPFDCRCPLMSLPLAFQTQLHSIPAALPYLHVPADRLAEWRSRLGEKTRPRIGLVWSGNPAQQNDGTRSLRLELLAPLFAHREEVEFHALYQTLPDRDRPALQTLPLRTWEAEIRDFADTGALLSLMDLVITSDTAVAHLAGALGSPVWVLLSHIPDFRWLLDRPDSPWYPGVMRLFRQREPRRWQEPVDQASGALRQWLDDLSETVAAARGA